LIIIIIICVKGDDLEGEPAEGERGKEEGAGR
jgi:hypothetical protein